MLEVYFAVAMILGGSLLVGRAVTVVLGRRQWTGLEAALGLAAMIAAAGFLARLPGTGRTVALGLGLLFLACFALLAWDRVATRRRGDEPLAVESSDVWAATLTGAVVTAALSLPFLINGHWGVIGVGINNDLGLHLAWTEWLRGNLGPRPDGGYPLGPHGLVSMVSRAPGVSAAQAFIGLLITVGVITALTVLAGLKSQRPGIPGPPINLPLRTGGRVFAACLVACAYLAASYYVQGAFKETAEALFVLTFTLSLPLIGAPEFGRWRIFGLCTILAGGIVFSYSFAGLAWPVAIAGLWLLTRPQFWATLAAPRRLMSLVFSPFTPVLLIVLAISAYLLVYSNSYGFTSGFSNVAGSDTYGPVSPLEALGLWPESSYRLDSSGWPDLAPLYAVLGIGALAFSLYSLLRRRLFLLPIALTACVIVYVASLPLSGDYSRAKALMIVAPLVMLVVAPVLLAGPRFLFKGKGPPPAIWALGASVFFALAVYSSFLALRDARVAPPGHMAELQSFIPKIAGEPVLFAGQDRFAAYALRGADTSVPLVEFPDDKVKESMTKPWDTGSAYSPIDFDSFDWRTLNRFNFVITGSAAWNSQPPPNFEEIGRTDSFILWRRTGSIEPGRHTLIEGTFAAAPVSCSHPEMEIFSSLKGRAGLMPTPVIGRREAWSPSRRLAAGEMAEMTLDLPAGEWRLSLQYFAPNGLTIEAPGFRQELIPALDGQRPSTISLANDGQFWPAGELVTERAGPVRVTARTPEPSFLQRLSGHRSTTYLGNLVALPVGDGRTVPLSETCGSWVDWYTGGALPAESG